MDELKEIMKKALIVVEKWEEPIHIGYYQWLALIRDEKFKAYDMAV